MNYRPTRAVWPVLLLCLSLLPGCGWWSAQGENLVDDDADVPDDVPAASSASQLPPAAAPGAVPVSGASTLPADRVTLVKTVSQTLRQPAPQGWVESRSTLELLLSCTI